MYAEGGGWRPRSEPLPPRPQVTKQQERIILWLIAINAIMLLVAPIGGVTILQAVLGH